MCKCTINLKQMSNSRNLSKILAVNERFNCLRSVLIAISVMPTIRTGWAA